jgi:sugar (glycoside-pentoside-hexuronide) transporter
LIPRHLQFAGYGFASIGNGIYSTVPGLLLMFYMTNILGIDVRFATLAIFAPKIIDVITDPLMGVISDRTRSTWGRRRPYLLVGICTLGPLFCLLFSSPEFNDSSYGFYFVTGIYILCTLAYTVFAVPYVALSAEIPNDYHERTTLNAYRMGFAMMGMLVSGALAPTIVEYFGGGRAGYRIMSICLGLIIGISWLSAFFTTAHVKDPEFPADKTLPELIRLVAQNRPFVTLLVTYVIQLTGMSCLTAALAYYVTYILHDGGSLISIIFLTVNLTAILAMPVWVMIGRRISKLHALYASSLILAITYFSLIFFTADSPRWLLLAVVCISGLGTGGQQLFSFAMLADTIVSGNSNKGNAGEAIYTGFFTASEKIGMAFGALVAGTIFAIMGLAETTRGFTEQSESALLGIRLAFSLAPSALIFLSLAVLYGYRTFEAEQQASVQPAG